MLAGLSVVIAVVSLGLAVGGPADIRGRALGYGIANVGFAVVNTMLGLLMLLVSRPG